jgi:cell division protein FtsB
MPTAAPPRPSRPSAPRLESRPSNARPLGPATRLAVEGRIRWDRVGRIALLALLAVVLALYLAPLRQWLIQSRAADEQRQTLGELEREHDALAARVGELRHEPALEREARRYGMVRRGERAFVIQPAPSRR